MTNNDPKSKVLFLIANEDGSADVETPWASDLGNDTYQLDNSPFFAYSVSWKEIVYAPYIAALMSEPLAPFGARFKRQGWCSGNHPPKSAIRPSRKHEA